MAYFDVKYLQEIANRALGKGDKEYLEAITALALVKCAEEIGEIKDLLIKNPNVFLNNCLTKEEV